MGAFASSAAPASRPSVPEFALRMMQKPELKGAVIMDPAMQLAVHTTWEGGHVSAQQFAIIRQGVIQFAVEVRFSAWH